MLFMAVATMPVFTSCDKDDDKKGNGNGNGAIGGTYTGTISVITGNSDATANLTKISDKYSLTLMDLKIATPPAPIPTNGAIIEIGDVTIENITISNGQLSDGDEISVPVTLPEGLLGLPGVTGTEITLKVALTSGAIVKDNLKFALKVSDVPMIQTVDVMFDGNK